MVPSFIILLLTAHSLLISVESYLILDGEHSIEKRGAESEDAKYQHLVYVGCQETDTYDGEKLKSIVGYAVSKMNITFKLSDNPKKSFEDYSAALQKKLGGGDPYQVVRELSETKTEIVLDELFKAMPMPKNLIPEKLKEIIVMAAQKATGSLDTGVHGLSSLFYSKKNQFFSQAEFAVLKIFRNGDFLEIIPCYMYVKGEKTEERVVFINKSWGHASIEYRQMRFMLTKYDLSAIIKAIKNTNWGGYW